ncbi:MAG: phosphotransferase family protein [Candidatus Hodarchaeales archaeon]|jgi:hypothetical protein
MAIVKQPDDKQLIEDLEKIGYTGVKQIKRRRMDSSPFTIIEEIIFNHKSKNHSMICKSLLPDLFGDEVIIHRAVSDMPINGPTFYHGTCKSKDPCYLLMENLNFQFLYNFLDFYTLKEVVQMLANFQNSYKKNKNLKSLPLKDYGVEWYTSKKHIKDCLVIVEKMVIDKQIMNEDLKPISMDEYNDFVNNYYKLIDMIIEFSSELPEKVYKGLILAHGDFDSGNIVIMNETNDVAVIDWGMSHLDTPLLDISHLFSSLQGLLPLDEHRTLVNHYFKSTSHFWGKNPDRWNLLRVGQVLHQLYYFHFQSRAIKNEWVKPNYYSERIYRKFNYFRNLLNR